MKALFTSLMLICILTTNAQVNIPNAGFENWTSIGGNNPDVPTGWGSFSMFPGIKKSTDAHSGNFALKLAVAQYFTAAGGADVRYSFGVPVTNTSPLYYTFWAKVNLSSTDKLNVDADMMKTPSTTIITGIPYGLNSLTTSDNTTVWKQFSFTLQTSTQLPVDTVSLRFYFSPQLDTASYVIIDDLAFTSFPAGSDKVSNKEVMEKAYPNPANNIETIIYSLNETAAVSLNVYDLLGNKISSVINEKQTSGRYKAEVDISAYPNGVYTAILNANDRSYTQKIVVQH